MKAKGIALFVLACVAIIVVRETVAPRMETAIGVVIFSSKF